MALSSVAGERKRPRISLLAKGGGNAVLSIIDSLASRKAIFKLRLWPERSSCFGPRAIVSAAA